MIGAILMAVVGVYFTLVGFGKAGVSKDPQANAMYLAKWGTFFRIAGPIVIIAGVVSLIFAI